MRSKLLQLIISHQKITVSYLHWQTLSRQLEMESLDKKEANGRIPSIDDIVENFCQFPYEKHIWTQQISWDYFVVRIQ